MHFAVIVTLITALFIVQKMNASLAESEFRERVERAIGRVRQLLDSQRSAVSLPDMVQHTYNDKFLLADSLTHSKIVAALDVLQKIGLDELQLRKAVDVSKNTEVRLRLEVEEECNFMNEKKTKVESPIEHELNTSGGLFGTSKVINKTTIVVTEYVFEFRLNYRLILFSGVSPIDSELREILIERLATQEIVLQTKNIPYEPRSRKIFDVNLGWLFNHITDEGGKLTPLFSTDRSLPTCKTPRRNEHVNDAVTFSEDLSLWGQSITLYFNTRLFNVQLTHGAATAKPDISAINCLDVFIPVMPLFEIEYLENGTTSNASCVSETSREKFRNEGKRSLQEKLDLMNTLFANASSDSIITPVEARFLVVMQYMQTVTTYYIKGVDYVESMLRSQLSSAIGKELQPSDFSEFMKSHTRKLLKEEYAPKAFCHSIRRSLLSSTEGMIRIEQGQRTLLSSEMVYEPIYALSYSGNLSSSAASPELMSIHLSAATKVRFAGERYLHGWLTHSFASSGESAAPPPDLQFVAQANQFSSFIVLIGRIPSATEFQPKYGFIAQNKDEFRIPLDLEVLPTAKEFKDAISSLSPSQQRFAQAIRGMQLESTLFGICIIQIKPQLEKVLNLPGDSLTKEIRLTQDLMKLFIQYQIPPDLLSFDASNSETTSSAQVDVVRNHVATINALIKDTKKAEVEESVLAHEYSFPGKMEAQDQSPHLSFHDEAMAPPVYRSKRQPKAAAVAAASFNQENIAAATASFAGVMSSAPMHTAKYLRDFVPEKVATTTIPVDVAPTITTTDAMLPTSSSFLTSLPARLDAKFDTLGGDSSVRATIINPRSTWTKVSQRDLLGKSKKEDISSDKLSSEKKAAFDLLDAITRAGALTLDHVALHVVVCVTHSFDKSLIDAVVKDDLNPIESLERSSLIMATAVHNRPVTDVISTLSSSLIESTHPSLLADL